MRTVWTILVTWAVMVAAVYVAALIVPGFDYDDFDSLTFLAAVLGLLNAILKPILKKLSVPLIWVTFGLFLIVLNTAMLGLAAAISDGLEDGAIQLDGIGAALAAAVTISVVAWVVGFILKPVDGK